jgi:hypothetical protein
LYPQIFRIGSYIPFLENLSSNQNFRFFQFFLLVKNSHFDLSRSWPYICKKSRKISFELLVVSNFQNHHSKQNCKLYDTFEWKVCGFIISISFWGFKQSRVLEWRLGVRGLRASVHFDRYRYRLLMKNLSLDWCTNIPSKWCFMIQATFVTSEFLHYGFLRKFWVRIKLFELDKLWEIVLNQRMKLYKIFTFTFRPDDLIFFICSLKNYMTWLIDFWSKIIKNILKIFLIYSSKIFKTNLFGILSWKYWNGYVFYIKICFRFVSSLLFILWIILFWMKIRFARNLVKHSLIKN